LQNKTFLRTKSTHEGMNKSIVLFWGLCILAFSSFAQDMGILRGVVIEARTGEPMIGASVVIDGTTIGTITDFDGNYTLNAPVGTHTIKISYISYQTKTFEGVSIKSKEVTKLDAKLADASVQLTTVTVSAKRKTNTVNALMVMKQKSATLIDGISSEQISKMSDGDAAAAIKRVTGVTVQGGKYVYVRGLSDRYSKITLNGAEIPGLDPNKNTVQMDMFPSNIVEQLKISKTFSPDLPGDATGGHVDIVTKDFPDKFTLQASASFGYNPQANLNDEFLAYEGGKNDWLGLDDGTRDAPSEAINASKKYNGLYYQIGSDYGYSIMEDVATSFSDVWEPTEEQSFIDQSYKFALGNQGSFLGKTLGYNLALSYSNSYDYFSEGYSSIREDIRNTENPSALREVEDRKGSQQVRVGGFLSTNLKLSNNHKLGLVLMRNHAGESMSSVREGAFPYESQSTNIKINNLAYLERAFNSAQINGKHVIPSLNKSKIDWLSSYTYSIQNEPDLRFFNYLYELEDGDTANIRLKTNDRPVRYYRDLSELNWDNKFNMETPFEFLGAKSKFNYGASFVYKNREVDEQKFVINQLLSDFDGDMQAFLEQHVSESNIGGFIYEDDIRTDMQYSYTGESSVGAGYAMVDMPLSEKLRIVTGIRYENTYIFVKNMLPKYEPKYKESELNEFDFLPALNLTYALSEKMNIRFATSKTIGRPVFREIAPSSFYDYKIGQRFNGNPNLQRTSISNVDLRWEYFFGLGEVISFSGFYKHFNKPIELVSVPDAGNPEVTYANTDESYLLGGEFEFRKGLNFIHLLNDFTLGTNLTWVKSVVTIQDSVLSALDPSLKWPDTRPMSGQAPYVINAYLGYNNDSLNFEANIGFNITGEKLFLVTKGGTPYVYEQPKPELDFTMSKGMGEHFTIEFGISNLLDSEYSAVYHYDSGDKDYIRYSSGRTFTFGFKYLIN
jgi:outer membrane receptor for ferrienterochelin and colicin